MPRSPELRHWLEADSRNALAYRQVSSHVGDGRGPDPASAPEIMVGRRDALEDGRRAARSRWSARRDFPTRAAALAASVLDPIAGGFAWFYLQRSVYATDLGERRVLTLPDSSVVTLDARSRIRVHYRENERLISLERGQARFDVAKDPARPFRVRAGAQTVVALGTQFNVELVADNVLVTMIEGHVAVTGVERRLLVEEGITAESKHPATPEDKMARSRQASSSARRGGRPSSHEVSVVELIAGEGLRVREDGQAIVLTNVDVERATAWQTGKIFFDNEPLANAVERVNRYSRDQIEVDPSVASLGISGVFNAGDSSSFIEAVIEYFPVQVHRAGGSEIRLAAPQ